MTQKHNFDDLLEKWARPFSSLMLVLSSIVGIWFIASDSTPEWIKADLLPIVGSCLFLGFAIGFVGMWLMDKVLPKPATMLITLFSSVTLAFAVMALAIQNDSQSISIITYEALALLILAGTIFGAKLGGWLFEHPYM